jgi:hypothetical protein
MSSSAAEKGSMVMHRHVELPDGRRGWHLDHSQPQYLIEIKARALHTSRGWPMNIGE